MRDSASVVPRVEGGWKKRAQNFSTFRSLPRPSLAKSVQHMRDFGFMLEGDLLVRSRESYSVESVPVLILKLPLIVRALVDPFNVCGCHVSQFKNLRKT